MAMGPTNGMWTPDMPIRFGAGQGEDIKPGQGADARWDPSKGMKFA